MKILITGICGFVGSTIAREIRRSFPQWDLVGIDNFSRTGSQLNKPVIEKELGIQLITGDIRFETDIDALPACDWIIDAAAIPSVLAGVDGKTSSRELIEHNLFGTINLLEYCKRHNAGFILLSTSRVYSIPGLAGLEMEVIFDEAGMGRFVPSKAQDFPVGISGEGVSEEYSTAPPVSLYGSTKVASEHLALEYGLTFGFPVWINRCGVMAGAGQFGHPAQGIFAYWIHSFREDVPLKYIGFGGKGYQVRDCLHPADLVGLLKLQMHEDHKTNKPRIINTSGGLENSLSLAQLTDWCRKRFPDSSTDVKVDASPRPFDIPWMVLDSQAATEIWGWKALTPVETVCEDIASFAEKEGDWLIRCKE